ncbi:Hypothetical predicted protein, partial [Lynx pardinus]
MYYRAPRLLRLSEGGSTEEHVGPGSYQIPFLKRQATGGYAPFLSLAARDSTFTIASNTEKAVPGPGHYNVSEAQKFSRSPTVSRSVDVPSIPSCGRSYGYDINEDGSIIKHFPPASDSTLGPAYYKPQFAPGSELSAQSLTQGLNSRTMRSRPEPKKKTPHYENINIKKDQQQNHCSYLPRFYEVIIQQEEKK